MNIYTISQQGRLLYPGSEANRFGPERPQRLSRVNRSGDRIYFGAAVTDAISDGCIPPQSLTDRILGFALQITIDDVLPGMDYVPDKTTYYPPCDMVCVSLNDRIKAIAPCDVFDGDPVFVEVGTGLPCPPGTGIQAGFSRWVATAMAGSLSVIQISTRVPG